MHGAADLEVPLEVAESHGRPRWRERPIRDPDTPEFQRLVRRQLELLGENPDREGLQKTPERVATSLAWLTRGYGLSAAEAVGDAVFEETHENMVLVRDIELYSLCEHHLLPFFGKAAIAYIPDGKILGLSKLPRIVEVFARRLQVQERLTEQIAQAIQDVLHPRGVGVVIEAVHLCMMMRGVEKQNSRTITSALRGQFKECPMTRDEFLSWPSATPGDSVHRLHPGVMSGSIGDYAIIGNCRSAGLISRDGSLDWLCWPRFDSPSLFAALLDPVKGGRFAIRPVGSFSTERRYVGDTNVLETTFRAGSGVARVTDLMPVCSEEDRCRELWPQHQLLRTIECLSGNVELEIVCDPRPDYGRTIPHFEDRGLLGLYYERGNTVLILRSELPLIDWGSGNGVRGRCALRAGDRRHVSLIFSQGEPAIVPPLGTVADQKIKTSVEWWERWISRCSYQGPYRSAVIRSALTLKLMAFAPSGAVIAAPTTSLPERLGGVRNWDYRYCWLRDASLTLQALFDLGFPAEAESFLAWLIHTTSITWPELRILYDVYGSPRIAEQELGHLAGFAGSRPVRVGNAADDQLQLDVYGELLDAVYQFVQRGGRLDRATRRMLVGFGETVCRRWREPDEGIWEIRAGRRHHTYSKVMCWVALDRLLRLHRAGYLRVPEAKFAREQAAIRDCVESHGVDAGTGSYVSVLGGGAVDVSLLQLGRYGYADPASPRMRSTLAAVRARLGGDTLLYRYVTDDGLPPGEGAFGIGSFWAVTAEALGGDNDRAAAAFEALLSYANDLDLYAEEIDPDTGALLGNFPQAFTHVGLIDAALTLSPVNRRRLAPAELPDDPQAGAIVPSLISSV